MNKLPVLVSLFFVLLCFSATANVMLTAVPNAQGSAISLRWNMVNHSLGTAYLLLRSIDGIVWQIAAANPVYRNYTSSTILAFLDDTKGQQKLYYKVRVYDTYDITVALSNTAVATISTPVYTAPASTKPAVTSKKSNPVNGRAWQLYPNPVHDVLNLSYNRIDRIRGVINVFISDATGKIVTRFRQASNNKQLRIPVSNLRSGLFFIKITVLNELQLNDKFIKQ